MIDSLLLIGRPAGMELLVSEVLQLARTARVCCSLASAMSIAEQTEFVIVLQHWSDEYPTAEIQPLLELYASSRLIVVQGPWCLSDRRNRQFWPSAICVSIENALTRIHLELEVIAGVCAPLPWTAGLDEIFAFDHGSKRQVHSPSMVSPPLTRRFQQSVSLD